MSGFTHTAVQMATECTLVKALVYTSINTDIPDIIIP